jgi:peroxiredoxin
VIVGDKAPDFTLLFQTGENVSLSKLIGKKYCSSDKKVLNKPQQT